MKSTVYVVRNDNGTLHKYLAEYKITDCIFSASWCKDAGQALEMTKDEATSLAARLKNDWNGRKFKALQKCRCKIGRQ